jgi:hypothetical protein
MDLSKGKVWAYAKEKDGVARAAAALLYSPAGEQPGKR